MRSLGTIRDLAGGRLPPLTRTALLAGLAVFLAALLLFRPTDGGLPPAQPLRSGVRWVGAGNALTEMAVLLDPSVAYLPARWVSTPDLGYAGPKTTEEAPFPRLGRRLVKDPLKTEEPPLRTTDPLMPGLTNAVPLADSSPFTTFGRANLTQGGLPPRIGYFEVYTVSGGKKPIISGILPPLDDKNNDKSSKTNKNSPLWSNYEAIIGVDAFGVQGAPAVSRSSGDKTQDQALGRWAATVPWGRYLAPGSYRLIIVP